MIYGHQKQKYRTLTFLEYLSFAILIFLVSCMNTNTYTRSTSVDQFHTLRISEFDVSSKAPSELRVPSVNFVRATIRTPKYLKLPIPSVEGVSYGEARSSSHRRWEFSSDSRSYQKNDPRGEGGVHSAIAVHSERTCRDLPLMGHSRF